MAHGLVDVFAYQEALLIEAVLGIMLLAMLWVGFRRRLQYKEATGRLIADQMAERDARYGAQMERIEVRLKAIEQTVTDGGERIDAPRKDPLLKGGEALPNP